MNLQFWKHKTKSEVIGNDCYNKLPDTHQSNYEETDDEPTHKVEYGNDDFLATLLVGEAVSSMMDSGSSDSSSSFDTGSSSPDVSFGGGDFGGCGASGSW